MIEDEARVDNDNETDHFEAKGDDDVAFDYYDGADAGTYDCG